MSQFLFHAALTERGNSARFHVHPYLRRFYDQYVRSGVRGLLVRTPPVYDINNIAKYIQRHEPDLATTGPALVLADDDGFTTQCPQLDTIAQRFAMPMIDFECGGCWMEQVVSRGTAGRDSRRGWYVFRAEDEAAGGEFLRRPLCLVEFVGVPGREVSVNVAVRIELDDDEALIPSMHLWAPLADQRFNRAAQLALLVPEYSVRVAPVLMALCVLRSKTGFSMPQTDGGRGTIMRQIGVRASGEDYMFEDGPRMRHFVRGHFRIYRRGRETPHTAWVVPHTRGSRRPVMSEQHRRRLRSSDDSTRLIEGDDRRHGERAASEDV